MWLTMDRRTLLSATELLFADGNVTVAVFVFPRGSAVERRRPTSREEEQVSHLFRLTDSTCPVKPESLQVSARILWAIRKKLYPVATGKPKKVSANANIVRPLERI